MKRKVYYAHPISLYGSQQEGRDIGDLIRLGFDPYNPNEMPSAVTRRTLTVEETREALREVGNR